LKFSAHTRAWPSAFKDLAPQNGKPEGPLLPDPRCSISTRLAPNPAPRPDNRRPELSFFQRSSGQIHLSTATFHCAQPPKALRNDAPPTLPPPSSQVPPVLDRLPLPDRHALPLSIRGRLPTCRRRAQFPHCRTRTTPKPRHAPNALRLGVKRRVPNSP